MKMRKWYIALLTLLALTACWQESVLPEGDDGNFFDPTKLRFNLSFQHPDGATKGVKKVWKDGDKVFLFINGITTGYLTATLTNTSGVSTWTTAYEGTDLASLGASGSLQAVYLPYVNNDTPNYDAGQWSFSGGTGGTDTYYFYASNIPYTVSNGILSATVQMVKPMDYVQLFIPCANASGTIQLACNGLRPAGFASIAAADGTVIEKALGAAGTAVHGYPDTLDGEEGYYVSGKQTAVTGNDYYFALRKADGTSYAHYFKHRTSAMENNKAYQLPAYGAWLTVGGSRTVQIAGNRWKTVNKGADTPWEMEGLTPAFTPGEGEGLPTASDWDNLLDPNVATWKEMDIMGQKGYLVVSVDAPSNYIFLPWSTSSATDYWVDEFGSVVRIATDGTKTNNVSPAPGTAYARLVENLSYFKIKATEDGTTMTFRYTDGTIVYSDNQGESWLAYTGQQFSLNAGDEVWFRGTRTTCDCDGDNQLFKANKVCYIAGDITSLLANPTTLPDYAFRSAFSKATFNTGSTSPGAVTWVNIDPGDPLILPATTSGYCYTEMFRNCTNLTTAPDLPATNLATRCYYRMFHSTGITSLPSMPSTVTFGGDEVCYQMFQSCTRITSIAQPLFGGTMTLRKGCFQDMFAHCTGLVNIPDNLLPATTLAVNCYRGMFQDTGLTRAPFLLVETLSWNDCYRYMFYGCKSLTYIKCLATNPGTTYTTNFTGGNNLPNSGIFVRNDDNKMTSSWPSGANGIPSGWTVKQNSEETVAP